MECIERHKEATKTRAAGESNVGTGLVFTHFSDVAKIVADHDEGFTLYTASTDATSAPHGVSTKNNNAHKDTQVWVVDEQTLLSGEIRSNMFKRISHIHFPSKCRFKDDYESVLFNANARCQLIDALR